MDVVVGEGGGAARHPLRGVAVAECPPERFDALEPFCELVGEDALSAALPGDGVAAADDGADQRCGAAEDGGDVGDRVGADPAGRGRDAGEDHAEDVEPVAAGAGVRDPFGDALDAADGGGVGLGGDQQPAGGAEGHHLQGGVDGRGVDQDDVVGADHRGEGVGEEVGGRGAAGNPGHQRAGDVG